jgi:O-antigen/teichoic acid export membrane protein
MNALILPLSLVTSIVLTRLLVKTEYGHLVYFYSGIGLLRSLMNLGLGMVLSRDVAAAWDEPDRLNRIVYSSTIVRLLSILGALLLLALVSLAAPIDFLAQMTAATVCASLADFVFAIIAGSRRTWHISLMSAFQPVAYLCLALGAVVAGALDSQTLMLLYVLSFCGMALLGVLLLVAGGRLRRPARGDMHMNYVRSAIGHAVPGYLAALSFQAWSAVVAGSFGMTGQFERSAEFGIAFTAITFSVAVSGPTAQTVFFPQASYLHGARRREELLRHIRRSAALFTSGLLWIGVLLFSFADALAAIFGPQYAPAAPYIAALAPAAPLMGILPIFTLSLFAIGRSWRGLAGPAAMIAVLLGMLLLAGGVTPGGMIAAVLLSAGVGVVVQMGLLSVTLGVVLVDRNVIVAFAVALALVVLLRALLWRGAPAAWQITAALGCSCVYAAAVLAPRSVFRRGTSLAGGDHERIDG